MGETIKMDTTSGVVLGHEDMSLVEVSQGLLVDARSTLDNKKSLSIPIAELSTLGAGVSSLIPALNTVTQTSTIAVEGLYTLANAGGGDVLKVAKNGNFWGAFKTADGGSKFAQLQAANPITGKTKSVVSFNPATMLMAVALYSIEQKLGDIEEMQKQILSFLEIEKESEIEADVEMLSDIINKYKFNWDNEHYLASSHKMVMDIQRTARKNMNGYQKKVSEVLNSKKWTVMQNQVSLTLKDLLKKFKYYRLSLYTFSLASMLEIMLSGNFKEEYINGVKNEIERISSIYRNVFDECSVYIEKMSKGSIDTNVLKGIGNASKKVGKFIGNIPIIKEGAVDEFLQDSGSHIKSSVKGIEQNSVGIFAQINNPETLVFINKMEDMIQIYNHTERICFDDKKIYLVADK